MFRNDRARLERSGRRVGSLIRVHEALKERPILSLSEACKRTTLSFPTASAAMDRLVQQGIAREITGTGPMVEIFPDRIEFSNPGEPLIAPDRFVDAPPRSRNEDMAALMRRVGICGERGSGIDKVVSVIELALLPAPLFEMSSGATRSVMFAHRDLKHMERTDRVRAVYLHACLRYVMREKTTNATLRQRFGIDARNAAIVSRLLNEAVEAGVIAIENPDAGRRSRTYLPIWAVRDILQGLPVV